MESFKARRENIMNMFSQAKQDLEQLNTEIDVAIAGRKEKLPPCKLRFLIYLL